MSRVFAVQQPKRLNPRTGTLEDHVDLSPAEEHGEVTVLLPPGAGPFKDLDNVVEDLRVGLEDFGPTDYLLLVGNPVLIGLATALAADQTEGNLQFLQWSGARREYIKICARDIYGDLQSEQ